MGTRTESFPKNILLLEKVPYLLTVLFALVGWAVVHIVDRIEKTPTIEYCVETTHGSSKNHYEYTITNISHDVL